MDNNKDIEKVFSNIACKLTVKVNEEKDAFVFQSIQPYCEDILEQRISKQNLYDALMIWKACVCETIDENAVIDLIRIARVHHNLSPNDCSESLKNQLNGREISIREVVYVPDTNTIELRAENSQGFTRELSAAEIYHAIGCYPADAKIKIVC